MTEGARGRTKTKEGDRGKVDPTSSVGQTRLLDITLLELTSDGIVLNTALIRATKDTEETVLTPVGVPRVSHKPVRSSTIDTPAEDLHCMTTKLLTRDMLVNTRRVLLKVSIHSEGDFNWTAGKDFLLDLLSSSSDGIGGGKDVLILSEWSRIGGVGIASSWASWSWVLSWGALGVSGVVVVVFAVGERVLRAPSVIIVVSTSHSTSADEVLPCCTWITTVAAETA